MINKIPLGLELNVLSRSAWSRNLWNTNTPAIVSCDADLTENYMYISMKFRTGVHVFSWEVGVFNRSCFQSVSCKGHNGKILPQQK